MTRDGRSLVGASVPVDVVAVPTGSALVDELEGEGRF
jgi:hypothetical protein